MQWYKTSLGKKYVMGLTGLLMVVFVIAHMLGNLSIFGGASGINAYAEHLRAFPPALWAFRGLMAVAFLLHIYMGTSLYLENRSARPIEYASKQNERTSFSARTMLWTGLLLGAFVIYHLLHFTLHAWHPEWNALVDEAGRFNVFYMVATSFSKTGVVVLYIAAMVVLLLHLAHGIQSFFQSLGLTGDKSLPKLETGGRGLAFILMVGFMLTPALIYFGLIKL